MDAERALVTKVAQTGKGAVELATEGIIDDHFIEEDCLEIWKFILAHQQKYGKQPTVPTILEEFPSFNFEMTEEPLDYIKDRFIESVERRHVVEFVQELAVASNDPDEAGKLADKILDQGRKLKMLLPEKGVARLSDAQTRIADYETRAASGKQYTGITIGIPEIDDATLGIQPHELVAIVGWQGTGKSTLAQWILMNFYDQGKCGLYISMEMTAEALLRKWDAMFQQFQSYRHLKMLNLSDEEVKRWKKWAEAVEKGKSDIVVVADGGSWTPDRVHGEIMKHSPDIVVIDYLTLMEASIDRKNEERWTTLTALSRALKQVSIQTNTPIIIINQTNRGSAKDGAELDNIGGSYAIGADSDIVIGLHQDDEMRGWNQMEVRLLKNRDGEIVKSVIYWDMVKMRFADSFQLEQVRKMKTAHELAEVTGKENGKPKLAHLLGSAARTIINTETGEIIEEEIEDASITDTSPAEVQAG